MGCFSTIVSFDQSSSSGWLYGCIQKKVAIAVFRLFCFVVVGWVFRVRNIRARCNFRKASPSEADATHLRIIKIIHMMIVICFLVKNGSFIRDLMEELFVMDNVCDLLNRKPSTNKVLWWKHLGARLEIKRDILDDLSPPQVHECPTEALIRYLGNWKPDLKIGDFITALRKTCRPDAIAVLEGYLPGRSSIKLELSTKVLYLI